jgi:hypothetical protein
MKALFGLPAVRFRLVDQDGSGRPVAPWEESEDHQFAGRAQLQVFGTIVFAPAWDPNIQELKRGVPWFRTQSIDGPTFLEEVLGGRRRWYPPMTLGSRRGLWALKSDVARYYRLRKRADAVT